MEEIIKKRIIIKDKLEYLAHASNTANHRKLKSRLSRELTLLDERSRNILAMKLANGALTIEKFDVADATRYKNQKGIIKYPTWYSPIENQPAAFIGSENILKKFKIYPQEMSENTHTQCVFHIIRLRLIIFHTPKNFHGRNIIE